ncbi:peroxidase family protein [Sphingomonas sp. 4RDLI-65]|uniref:peroxidase family protein n=1 Tax=Sphingomonas sp. 4RDLI-65 TaxID=3111641 RepID=UPI003C2AA940
MVSWSETYAGGSAEAERLETERLAIDIMRAQIKARKAFGGAIDRAFHAKALLGVERAKITFLDTMPDDLVVGFAHPGARYDAIVRISNAANHATPDYKPDLRGIAVRIIVSDGEQHDLLATNYPVSHARNARQFVRFAKATAGGSVSRLLGLIGLIAAEGPSETVRMLRNVGAARKRVVRSIALETYWSRGAMCWGREAVRFQIRPASNAPPAPDPVAKDPGYLGKEAVRRLAHDDIVFELCVQRFVDEATTPIEDTAIPWRERDSAFVPVATIRLPGGMANETNGAVALAESRAIDGLSFNPWNTTDEFRPLGNLNRARKSVYDASAAHRQSLRWHADPPRRNTLSTGAARMVFRGINRFVAWHKLPLAASLLNLDMFRFVLRRDNLIDTDTPEAPPVARPAPPAPDEDARLARSFDGVGNDLSKPLMGSVGQPFGRNLKPDYRPDLMDTPNPITVSDVLLKREAFIPARSLNILAAAWIQFQVHDWVDHERLALGKKDVRIPLPPGTPRWRNTPDGPLEDTMRVAGNVASTETPDGIQRVFANQASHWWDGSEVYGATLTQATALREGARLRLPDGYLPTDLNGMDITGFNQSWWMGLSALHTLFAREHNLLCDELQRHYPIWTDDRVYHTARLIVSALIAKIHTVEWTPAILATKAIDTALKNNWNGPPANDWLTKGGLWLLDAGSGVGIPKTMPDHHGAPYCLTEDFATVYRLHPLIPDDYAFYDHRGGGHIGTRSFADIQGRTADDEMRRVGLGNALYSFGIAHPGAITLHNYPDALRSFDRDGEMIDLAVVDLVRTRRRGVPRYNDFRAGLHKPRITRWKDLTDDPETVRQLRDVYRSIDEVDTMVGLFAEPVPTGFGFSDTAFRIFILMASRRLQSDRFLTVDFRPEIYSPFGMDWIERNTMTSVILRHCPELAATLPRDASAFAPWRPVPSRKP